MTIRHLFPTSLYEATLDDAALLAELDAACRQLAVDDRAGRAWAKDHGYRGYTSYASLNDLPTRDPAFAALKRRLDRHVMAFATEAGFQLNGRKPVLDSLWVNILKGGGAHSGHIHPHSMISGTLYIAAPPGSGALRLEDPRLPLMMAAPERPGTFAYVDPAPGAVLLWESWLRHEVTANAAKAERISVSFNYR